VYSLAACALVTSPAKKANRSRYRGYGEGSDGPKEPCIDGERHLANTTERFVLGGDAGCRKDCCHSGAYSQDLT